MRATTVLLAAATGGSRAVVSAYTTSTGGSGFLNVRNNEFPTSRFRVALSEERRCCALAGKSTALNMGMPWIGGRQRGVGVSRQRPSGPTTSSIFKRVSSTVRPFSKAIRAIRRMVTILFAAAIVMFGSAPVATQPSHASTAVSATTAQPTVQLVSTTESPSKAKLDKMIEKYVRRHMFNDDAFDPFESAYREAHYDQTGSPYPTIITETAADILGKKEVAAKAGREGSALDKAWEKLNSFADVLEKKFGINKQLSLSTMFIGIFCTPVVVLFLGAIAFGERQKEKSEQMALERYGYGLNDLSAAEQIGEDIEAPDDEDEEDEDEDNEDDED